MMSEENENLESVQEEEKKLEHIKGLFTFERGADYYRVVFYDDNKHLIFKELDYDRVDFVGRFHDDSFDATNLSEMEQLAEKALTKALSDRKQKRFL